MALYVGESALNKIAKRYYLFETETNLQLFLCWAHFVALGNLPMVFVKA